jgi:hypothetical protein
MPHRVSPTDRVRGHIDERGRISSDIIGQYEAGH